MAMPFIESTDSNFIHYISHRYRPTHPKDIYERIATYASKNSIGLDLVVDIGCGSGQSTHQLSPYARKVVGTDISSAQVSNAQPASNVSFVVAPADKLPFNDSSVSLLACGQAWHYMDPLFVNPEILRVLRRPGVLAVYGHDLPLIENETCRSLTLEFYRETLKGYWHESRKHIDNHFRSVSFPLPLSERQEMVFHSSSTLDDYISYVKTWSGYRSYVASNPDSNALEELRSKLYSALKLSDSTDKISLATPYFLLLCLYN